MPLNTTANFPGGAINASIADKLLEIAKRHVVFQQIGEKAKMPSGEGRTYQFNRYERLNLPLLTLTEGSPPVSTDMALTTVQATADQWGAFVELSDVAILTIKHPLLAVAMDLLGVQVAELIEREIINVLLAGTSVTFAANVANRAALTTPATHSLADGDVQRVVARMRTRGAHPYESDKYVGVVHPNSEQDISTGTTNLFSAAASYSSIKVLFNGEIGTWRGVRFMASNMIPQLLGQAAHAFVAGGTGTFAAANYRITLAGYDSRTGFLVSLTQNSAVTFTLNQQLQFTTPNVADRVYRVFISAAGAGATAAMFQGVANTFGTGFLPANTAIVVLAPPSSGLQIAGSEIPATNSNVHFAFVFGKQAYCTVDLQNLQTFVSKPEPTTVDPLVQRRTVGYKLMFKPVIQNQQFMERIECLSQYG